MLADITIVAAISANKMRFIGGLLVKNLLGQSTTNGCSRFSRFKVVKQSGDVKTVTRACQRARVVVGVFRASFNVFFKEKLGS